MTDVDEPDEPEVPIRATAVCMSCGSPAETGRRRCPECGAPQRRVRLSSGRVPVGPLVAVGLVAALLVGGLAWMMLGDKKAGPARAYEALRTAALERRCSEVAEGLSAAGRAAFPSESAVCDMVASFDWSGAAVRTVRVEGGTDAVVCVAAPSGAGVSMHKTDGIWRYDSPIPAMRQECVGS